MVINIHRGDVGYVIDVYNTADDLVCTNSIWDDDLDAVAEAPDIVTVTCYGDTKEYTREEAIEFFKEGMWSCDPGSSEYSRYATIVDQLESGSTHACDTINEQENPWQAMYDKHGDVKCAEALKEAYRELKEKTENDIYGESYLDEVAEAASEQRAKAME